MAISYWRGVWIFRYGRNVIDGWFSATASLTCPCRTQNQTKIWWYSWTLQIKYPAWWKLSDIWWKLVRNVCSCCILATRSHFSVLGATFEHAYCAIECKDCIPKWELTKRYGLYLLVAFLAKRRVVTNYAKPSMDSTGHIVVSLVLRATPTNWPSLMVRLFWPLQYLSETASWM